VIEFGKRGGETKGQKQEMGLGKVWFWGTAQRGEGPRSIDLEQNVKVRSPRQFLQTSWNTERSLNRVKPGQVRQFQRNYGAHSGKKQRGNPKKKKSPVV